MKIPKNKLEEIKEDINKENESINELINIFQKTINSIQKKFDDVINNKKLILQFKQTIEEIYESKDSNFQMIENIKRLKFNNYNLNIDKDMNELDILFEIFSYLNCIDYNMDIPKSNSNTNDNSYKENIVTENDIKEKIDINNELNNFIQKNNEFIYEKKQKTNIYKSQRRKK